MSLKLVTGWAEYYVYIEADSDEEALEKAKKSKDWRRTMNWPMEDFSVEEAKVDTEKV